MLKRLKSSLTSLVGGDVRDGCLRRSISSLSLHKCKGTGEPTEWKSISSRKSKAKYGFEKVGLQGVFPQHFISMVNSGVSWGQKDLTRHCIPLLWAFSLLSQRGGGTMACFPQSQLDGWERTSAPRLSSPHPVKSILQANWISIILKLSHFLG